MNGWGRSSKMLSYQDFILAAPVATIGACTSLVMFHCFYRFWWQTFPKKVKKTCGGSSHFRPGIAHTDLYLSPLYNHWTECHKIFTWDLTPSQRVLSYIIVSCWTSTSEEHALRSRRALIFLLMATKHPARSLHQRKSNFRPHWALRATNQSFATNEAPSRHNICLEKG